MTHTCILNSVPINIITPYLILSALRPWVDAGGVDQEGAVDTGAVCRGNEGGHQHCCPVLQVGCLSRGGVDGDVAAADDDDDDGRYDVTHVYNRPPLSGPSISSIPKSPWPVIYAGLNDESTIRVNNWVYSQSVMIDFPSLLADHFSMLADHFSTHAVAAREKSRVCPRRR